MSPARASLVFRMREFVCALPLEHVVETMRPLPVERVADMPAFVRGLALIRGTPVPVVDAGALFGASPEACPTRFVTVRAGQRWVALGVEEIVGLRELPTSLEALPPLLREARAEVISAIGRLDSHLLMVLETARLVPEPLWSALGAAGAA